MDVEENDDLMLLNNGVCIAFIELVLVDAECMLFAVVEDTFFCAIGAVATRIGVMTNQNSIFSINLFFFLTDCHLIRFSSFFKYRIRLIQVTW